LAPILRTPASSFAQLPDFTFPPRYVEIVDPELGPLRVHYVDEGPRDAEPILLVHGQPSWSYLYRHVIANLVDRGHRVVAADNIGFGRSDTPRDKHEHTYARHVAWHAAFVHTLDLRRITVVGQDWGGPIGFGALAREPARYHRAVATNTILHCADPSFADRLLWANHGTGTSRVVLEERLVDYVLKSQREPLADVRIEMRRAMRRVPDAAELDSYASPFPHAEFLAGPRQMPVLIPLTRTDPGSAISRETWAALSRWTKPFLTAYSDGDPATAGFDGLFRERVPGAANVAHPAIPGAGHFVQEDQPSALSAAISDFVRATPDWGTSHRPER
jgi:haloalkane dehalogenase